LTLGAHRFDLRWVPRTELPVFTGVESDQSNLGKTPDGPAHVDAPFLTMCTEAEQ